MKFKISRSTFFKSLSHLQGIVDKKNSLPILSNILIEDKNNQLILSSTDMDISIIEKINCTVSEDGATTINAQVLYDIVRKIDDKASIEIISNNGKLLTLRADGSRFSLASLPKEDYPIIEQKGSVNDVFGSVSDISRADQELDWKPLTSISKGISETIFWAQGLEDIKSLFIKKRSLK